MLHQPASARSPGNAGVETTSERPAHDSGVPMGKTLRIWIDGKLRVDTVVPVGQVDVRNLADYLPNHGQKAIALASRRGQPWRLEFGDQDADVEDGHWLG